MVIFKSESELVELLDQMDRLIADCIAGSLELRAFYDKIGYLHSYHALDGHESDEEELGILKRHSHRIAWVDEALLAVCGICAEEDSTKEAYIKAGRYGAAEALRRLRSLVASRMAERA